MAALHLGSEGYATDGVNGNVGIGTTTPSEKLYISGDSARFIIRGVTNTSFTATHVQNSDGDGVEMASYGRNASGSYLGLNKAGAAFYGGSPNTVLGVGTRNATPLVFGTNDTERMRITEEGNVGIGTTIPAASAKLEIASTTGALLLSRMTTAQRDGLTAVAGMVIYNTSTGTFQGCTVGGGTPTWVNL